MFTFYLNIDINEQCILKLRVLDKIWLKRAEQELGENDTVRSVKLKQLAERIAQDENVPPCRRDNAFLLRFLRVKKFDVDKAFRMVNEILIFVENLRNFI